MSICNIDFDLAYQQVNKVGFFPLKPNIDVRFS